MRRTRQELGFVALKIEGGILPAEFLQKVVALEAKGQSGKDYKLPKGTTIKDEIGRAWRIASAEWREYRENCERQDVDRVRIGIDQWLFTLLKVVLGHEDIGSCAVAHMGDRAFPITHKSMDGAVPLVLTTENFRLDKTDTRFGEEGRRRSPHALMQEFLNANDDCLWGIISNGKVLQLLRDNPSLTKPAYIEADLERIFEEQLYSDFAAMWLIFHGSRFACGDGKPSACFMEEWRKEGHETGERALADLRKGVTAALLELGNGFLHHNHNVVLRDALQSGSLSADAYFKELLRLVYRLLFLLCVEDREFLHKVGTTEEARELYRRGYSVSRLRQCALLKRNYDKHFDLWEGLRLTFHGLYKGEEKLGLPALGGLFVDRHCPYIDGSVIENRFLLRAIFELSFFRSGDVLARVNYRDMGTEELGSVYESLLELHPGIDVEKMPWSFEFVGQGNGAGSERKLSGSYYTPASLVNELIRTAVDPVIEKVKTNHPNNPRKALLGLKIVDPACGSGHFLLAAARRLAIEVAKLDSTNEFSEEIARRHALREVVQSCIYGVDKNELALELCKTALWIEAVEPGRPLNFLDAHLRCGDSLVGILSPDVMEKGIPDDAYTILTSDDKAAVSELKRKNKEDNYEHAVVQGSVFDQKSMALLSESRQALDGMPEDTIEQVEAKQSAFKTWLTNVEQSQEEVKASLFVGAFFAERTRETLSLVPRTEDLNRVERGMAARSGVVEMCRNLSQRHKFFHWHLAFSEVFRNGGFDIVLGNPPWERIKLQEQEFFAGKHPAIANAKTKAVREKLIAQLFLPTASVAERILGQELLQARRDSEAVSLFLRQSGRFPLCGRGDINTYTVFAETMRQLISPQGKVGCVVPSGIATDSTTQFFFRDLMETGSLISLHAFENEAKLFPGIDHRVKFALVTLTGGAEKVQETDFAFGLHRPENISEPDRHFSLSAHDLELLNPNTGTCPIFRSRRDAELTKRIYEKVPVLLKETEPQSNPWGVKFQTMFHMTNDSHLFRSREDLETAGLRLNGNVFEKESVKCLPLYEAKMIWHFNHRFGTYEGATPEELARNKLPELTTDQLKRPNLYPLPDSWVDSKEVARACGEIPSWQLCFRGITSATLFRTLVGTILPTAAVGNSLPAIVFGNATERQCLCFLANLCSFIEDYLVRQSIGGPNLNFFIIKQIPFLPPDFYHDPSPWAPETRLLDWISDRALELVYTAHDLNGFATKCGYDGPPFQWDEDRRFLIRCELDAAFFHLYNLNEEDIEYILGTFHLVRERDLEQFGEERTKQTLLNIFQRMKNASTSGREYESVLDIPPGDRRVAHALNKATVLDGGSR